MSAHLERASQNKFHFISDFIMLVHSYSAGEKFDELVWDDLFGFDMKEMKL